MSMDMGTWDMGGGMGIARQDGRCLKGGVEVRGRGREERRVGLQYWYRVIV